MGLIQKVDDDVCVADKGAKSPQSEKRAAKQQVRGIHAVGGGLDIAAESAVHVRRAAPASGPGVAHSCRTLGHGRLRETVGAAARPIQCACSSASREKTREGALRLDRAAGGVHHTAAMGYHRRAETAAGPRTEGRATGSARPLHAGVGSGYRYYSPGLGRWVNRDPIGEDGGLNLSSFVNNDSVGGLDYLGLSLVGRLRLETLWSALRSGITNMICEAEFTHSVKNSVPSPFNLPYFSNHQLECEASVRASWGPWGERHREGCATPTGGWTRTVEPAEASTLFDGEWGAKGVAVHPAGRAEAWFYMQILNSRSIGGASLDGRIGFEGEYGIRHWNQRPCCRCLHVTLIARCEHTFHERSIYPRGVAAAAVAFAYAGGPAMVASGTQKLATAVGVALKPALDRLLPPLLPAY